MRYLPESGAKRRWELPCRVSCITLPGQQFSPPHQQGVSVFLCACEAGFAWMLVESGSRCVRIEPVAEIREDHPTNRFNDGKLGPDGAFYAGTMDDEERVMSGALYRLSPDFQVTTLQRDIGIPNGPAFSPDGSRMYLNDSMLGAVFAYTWGTDGRLSQKRLVRRYCWEGEAPDGMDVNRDHNVFVSVWGGGRVDILDADGQSLGVIRVASRNPTSVCIAGDDCLYLTTASTTGSPSEMPEQEGALFEVRLNV